MSFVLDSMIPLPITRDLAVRVSGYKRVPGERRLNSMRISALLAEIDAGTLTGFRWATASIRGQDEIYRINGQHTSHVFSRLREPSGHVILEHYVCDNIDDIVCLWSKYDQQFSSRSKNDVLNTAFESDPQLAGLPVSQRNIAAGALSILKFGYGYTNKVSNFEKAKAAIDHKDFVVWACKTFPSHSKCLKVGVFFAAFLNFKKNPEAATKFWESVQSATDPNPLSGARALERTLLEFRAKTAPGAAIKKLDWEQMAELCLIAFEKWEKGKDVHTLRPTKQGIAKYVEIPKGPYSKRGVA